MLLTKSSYTLGVLVQWRGGSWSLSLRFWMGRWCNVDGTKMKELQEQAVSLSEAREAARKTDGTK